MPDMSLGEMLEIEIRYREEFSEWERYNERKVLICPECDDEVEAI